MKYLILSLIAASFLSSCAVYKPKHEDITMEELNYGLCQTKTKEQIELENSLTGMRKESKDLRFIEETDSIKAILKSNFGVEYILRSPKDEYVMLEFNWTFPEGTKDSEGNVVEEIHYKRKQQTNIKSWSTYSLDEPNEVQKGSWVLTVKLDNKKLLQRNFYLY